MSSTTNVSVVFVFSVVYLSSRTYIAWSVSYYPYKHELIVFVLLPPMIPVHLQEGGDLHAGDGDVGEDLLYVSSTV